MDGLLMMRGKRIQAGTEIQGARILDLAPSILYLLGLAVPEEMDGKVLEGAVVLQALRETPIRLKKEESEAFRPEEVYNEAEEEELKERLRSLNYLK